MTTQPASVEYFPPRDRDREPLGAPVDEVTLLEDRAQVRRRARINLPRGHHRLLIDEVAPVAQDVSVRAEVIAGKPRLSDIGIRRAMRVAREHKPKELQEIEARIRELRKQWDRNKDKDTRFKGRLETLGKMLGMGTAEIPQDVAWGTAEPEVWDETFSTLFSRAHDLREEIVEGNHERKQILREYRNLVARRKLMGTPSQKFIAWFELDVIIEGDETVELAIDYTTPNAMWRPLHTARQEGDVLHFTANAALWQNTGEDWEDVQLIFSTARSSLGTEPPMLRDDLLTAQRKSDETIVEARSVAIQSASVGGSKGGGGTSSPPPGGVDLPGVDDGGEIQNLRAQKRVNVPSDGNPNMIPLFDFSALCELERVLSAELEPKVFLRSTQLNTSPSPILAGPVELLRGGGTIGWTQMLYVAPNERFELGFGPQEDMRVTRESHLTRDEVDPADHWRHRTTHAALFLSNLSDTVQKLRVVERVPTSEIEKVKIFILKNKTTQGYEVDDDGFVTWNLELEPYERRVLHLYWRLSTAPDVKGI
jgi:uncharacterized protein (TIGR02231 family)